MSAEPGTCEHCGADLVDEDDEPIDREEIAAGQGPNQRTAVLAVVCGECGRLT